MARTPAPTHWLRPNEREWTPGHVIYLHTETTATETDAGEVHSLRCWSARFFDRRARKGCARRDWWETGFDADTLSATVSDFAKGQKATWLWTHNLAFDLTVTRLVDRLHALGWQVTSWSVNGGTPWFRLTDGSHGLALTDSVGWLQAGLDKVAPMVGMEKLPLPTNDDTDQTWLDRCTRDVAIMAEAIETFMAWWEREGVGNFSITGNGCGWNAMRHRTPKRTILVRTGDGGRELERRAIYGGRRDATRWGDVPGGPFVTVDFEDAYPTIAANLRLPSVRMTPFDRLPLDAPELGPGRFEILAECQVDTTTPRYPLRHKGFVWYPVGRFTTTLAHPEIVEAKARGELVRIGNGFRYQMDGHLAGWARWVIDLAHGRVLDAPPVVRAPAKRWGRSVVGRFAQRTGESVHLGPAESVGWRITPGWDMSANVATQLVDLAGERWLVSRDSDADDAFPAVLAWVESYCRVRLNRLLDACQPGQWVSCNTDGAVLSLSSTPGPARKGQERRNLARLAVSHAQAFCDLVAPSTWPLVARPKDAYSQAWLAGPQTMWLDDTRVLSGIPRKATATPDGGFEAHLWPGMAWQMQHGNRSGFVRPLAHYTIPTVAVNRLAMRNGTTLALRCRDGIPSMESTAEWFRDWPHGIVDALAPMQSRSVTGLMPADLREALRDLSGQTLSTATG